MANNKSSHFGWLTGHCLIIFVAFLWAGVEFAAWNAIIHFAIDSITWRGYKFWRTKYIKENLIDKTGTFWYWKDNLFWYTLGFDQLLHILTIVFLLEYL